MSKKKQQQNRTSKTSHIAQQQNRTSHIAQQQKKSHKKTTIKNPTTHKKSPTKNHTKKQQQNPTFSFTPHLRNFLWYHHLQTLKEICQM
jgi:hypothetical protein